MDEMEKRIARSATNGVDIQEALGQSEAFLEFQEKLSRAAKVERPVLLIGERGTGKELAAARIHFLSKRWQEPFIALNCAALAPTLIESELFGHEAGAFTGAGTRRTGRFEAANGGTLLLDEIANIPMETQEKILRVVEYGSFERVGGSASIKVDVRIIGATNADLLELSEDGRFMRDLLDRLSFEVLFLPPLRHRPDDIMFLANHFAARMAMDLGWGGVPEFTDEAIDKLEGYAWPGNVRELKNVVERAVYRSDDSVITEDEIVYNPFESPWDEDEAPRRETSRDAAAAEAVRPPKSLLPQHIAGKPLQDAVRLVELEMMRNALICARFNQRKAADALGLTYHQFRGLYRKYEDELKEE